MKDESQQVALKRLNALEFHNLKEYNLDESQFQVIPTEPGDVLFWDWRLPHYNEDENLRDHFREVIYCGHLPNVPLNKRFAEEQLSWIQSGQHPPFMSKKFRDIEITDSYQPFKWSPLGRKLVAIDPWNNPS